MFMFMFIIITTTTTTTIITITYCYQRQDRRWRDRLLRDRRRRDLAISIKVGADKAEQTTIRQSRTDYDEINTEHTIIVRTSFQNRQDRRRRERRRRERRRRWDPQGLDLLYGL